MSGIRKQSMTRRRFLTASSAAIVIAQTGTKAASSDELREIPQPISADSIKEILDFARREFERQNIVVHNAVFDEMRSKMMRAFETTRGKVDRARAQVNLCEIIGALLYAASLQERRLTLETVRRVTGAMCPGFWPFC